MNIKKYINTCIEESFYDEGLTYIAFSSKYNVSTSQLYNILREDGSKVTTDKLIELSEKCGIVYKITGYKKSEIEDRIKKEEYEE